MQSLLSLNLLQVLLVLALRLVLMLMQITTITSNTFTKVQINTEEFDTNSNFDSTTNYRFTPTVAGYYQVNGSVNNYSSTYANKSVAQ
jgi:hypothetical protein